MALDRAVAVKIDYDGRRGQMSLGEKLSQTLAVLCGPQSTNGPDLFF
jgi:hypothetical protein